MRDAVPGMVAAWSAFLSCDARDMCRPGLAMARLAFMWMAVTLRVATVIAFPFASLDDVSWFYSVVYWGSRPDDAAYLEFSFVRDEAHRVRESWMRGELSDSRAREDAIRLSAELRRWREAYPNGYDLFSKDRELDGAPCVPFREIDTFFQLLEAQEDLRDGWFWCDYLLLLQ